MTDEEWVDKIADLMWDVVSGYLEIIGDPKGVINSIEGVVKAGLREYKEDIKKQLLHLASVDCPVSDQGLKDLWEAFPRGTAYWDRQIGGSTIAMSWEANAVKEVLQRLIDWLTARVAMMATDNGYQDGYEAGQEKGYGQALGEIERLKKEVKELEERLDDARRDLMFESIRNSE